MDYDPQINVKGKKMYAQVNRKISTNMLGVEQKLFEITNK